MKMWSAPSASPRCTAWRKVLHTVGPWRHSSCSHPQSWATRVQHGRQWAVSVAASSQPGQRVFLKADQAAPWHGSRNVLCLFYGSCSHITSRLHFTSALLGHFKKPTGENGAVQGVVESSGWNSHNAAASQPASPCLACSPSLVCKQCSDAPAHCCHLYPQNIHTNYLLIHNIMHKHFRTI